MSKNRPVEAFMILELGQNAEAQPCHVHINDRS
jgi:hypothetical protein